MSPAVLVVFGCATAVTTAAGAVSLLYAPYLEGYGYSLPAIGGLSSLFAILRLASRIPVGMAYRPAYARRQLALWLLGFAVTTSGFAVAGGSPVAVVVLTVGHGLAYGGLGTLILAIVIDLTGGRRAGAMMGWYTAALSVGYAVGAFVGGWLADAAGMPVALGVLGLLPAAAALLLGALPALEGPAQSVARDAGWRGLLAAGAGLDARVWLAFTLTVYLNLLADGVDTFFPLWGVSIGLPLAALGVLKGLKSGAAAFIRFVSGAIFAYVDYRAINVWAVALSGGATLLLPRFASFGAFAVLFTLLGLTRGILRVTSAAMVAETRSEGQDVGLASAVYNAGLDVGAIVGPIVGGLLGNAVGLPLMFQFVAGGSVAAYFAVAFATQPGRAGLRFAFSPRVPDSGRLP